MELLEGGVGIAGPGEREWLDFGFGFEVVEGDGLLEWLLDELHVYLLIIMW